MAKNKIKQITKTIGFRLEDKTVDAISDAAKEAGLTIQEFFLSHIPPGTKLGQILQEERLRMLAQSDNIANVRDQIAQQALAMRESFGLSEDAFELAATQAVKMLIRGKKSENDQQN